MKTNLSRKAAFAATALIVSLIAANTYGGPGPQYWANVGKNAAKTDSAKPAASVAACPGSQEVAVTVMKPAWTNGRGPLTEVQIGTERVCHMCPVATVATTNAWANGRGPVTQTVTTSVGAALHCSTGCTAHAVASN